MFIGIFLITMVVYGLNDISNLFNEEKERLIVELEKMKKETNANSVSINN